MFLFFAPCWVAFESAQASCLFDAACPTVWVEPEPGRRRPASAWRLLRRVPVRRQRAGDDRVALRDGAAVARAEDPDIDVLILGSDWFASALLVADCSLPAIWPAACVPEPPACVWLAVWSVELPFAATEPASAGVRLADGAGVAGAQHLDGGVCCWSDCSGARRPGPEPLGRWLRPVRPPVRRNSPDRSPTPARRSRGARARPRRVPRVCVSSILLLPKCQGNGAYSAPLIGRRPRSAGALHAASYVPSPPAARRLGPSGARCRRARARTARAGGPAGIHHRRRRPAGLHRRSSLGSPAPRNGGSGRRVGCRSCGRLRWASGLVGWSRRGVAGRAFQEEAIAMSGRRGGRRPPWRPLRRCCRRVSAPRAHGPEPRRRSSPG